MRFFIHTLIALLPFISTDSLAGTADPSGILGIIVMAIIAVGLLPIVISLLIPFAIVKGPWRFALLVPIIGFWGYLYYENFKKPETKMAWRISGYRKCELEAQTLPKLIPVNGLLDEGAGVTASAILQFFSERHLDFVEIYFPNSSTILDRDIKLDMMQGRTHPFIHFTLSEKGDPSCIKVSNDTERAINWVPFLPNTCLAATYLKEPMARYSVRLERDAQPEIEQYGTWTIVDRLTATKVASLTTSEKSYITAHLDDPQNIGHPIDCRSPHSVLLNRFTGIKPENEALNPVLNKQNFHWVTQTTVLASPPLLDLIANKNSLPLIQMTTVKVPFRSGEWEARTSPKALQERWQEAVKEASASGLGQFYRENGGSLLDWNKRNLIELKLIEKGAPIQIDINWDVSISERGFIVFTNNWRKNENQIVARYDISGNLDWAIQIPGVPEITGCGFGPRQAWATDDEIILSQPSCNNKEGTEWRLQKSAISFYSSSVTPGSKPSTIRR